MPVIAAIRMLREKNPGLSRGGTASEHPFLAFYSEFRTRLCPIQPFLVEKKNEDFSWQCTGRFYNTVVVCAEMPGELRGGKPHKGALLIKKVRGIERRLSE